MKIIGILLITFLPLVVGAHNQHEFCAYEKSELEVAEIVQERCGLWELSAKEIADKMHIEDDADGPGYKDLDYYFQGDSVAHLLLVEVGDNCMIEENFEIYCPSGLASTDSFAKACEGFNKEFAWGYDEIEKQFSCEGTAKTKSTACAVQAVRDGRRSFNIYKTSADGLGGSIMFNHNKSFTDGQVLDLLEIEKNTWMDQYSYKQEGSFKGASGEYVLSLDYFQRPTGPLSRLRPWDYLWTSSYKCVQVK